MAALDFPSSPTVGQQYAAPNGVTYQWDGAAWVVTGGPPGQLWTGAGTTLTPTDPSKTVTVQSGALYLPPGARITTIANLHQASINEVGIPGQDTSKPVWLWGANATVDSYFVQRAPANTTTAVSMLSIDGTGIVKVPGDANIATALLGAAIAKGRLQAFTAGTSAGGIGIFSNRNWNGNAQDDATRPSWGLSLQQNNDWLAVQRSPAGSTAQTNLLLLDNAGQLTISGPTATKASGTTWANPSDRRIKKNIEPYTQGLAAILALAPKTFEFNGKAGSQDGLRAIGLIADDVQPVMPEMVSVTPAKLDADDDAPVDLLTLDTSALTLALINAVKELTARIAALEATLTTAGIPLPTPTNV